MARIVIMHGHGPQKFATKDGVISICTCGLSKKYPLCDDSHNLTLDEQKDALYQYDETGKRSEVMEAEEDCEGCCGGCCDSECDEKASKKCGCSGNCGGGCGCDSGEEKESQCDCGEKCQCDGDCGGECSDDESECCGGCKHNAGTKLADECCAGHGHCHCCEAEESESAQPAKIKLS